MAYKLDRSEFEDYRRGDYLDTLGIESFARKDLEKSRGLSPSPTDAQTKAVEKLATKLTVKPPKALKGIPDSEVEDILDFDVLSAPRVILNEGKISKKMQSSLTISSSRRYMFLLNDVILVCSIHSSGSFTTSDKYIVHQIFRLDNICVNMATMHHDSGAHEFEIQTVDRSYVFITESDSEKKIWLEEIQMAVWSVHYNTPVSYIPGWQHEVVTGTFYAAAVANDMPLLMKYLCDMTPMTVDTADEVGMTALHWAALRGHVDVVAALLEAGADPDGFNNGLNSPLLMAASRGFAEVVAVLLDLGASPKVRNLKDRDSLFMAVLYGYRSKGLINILKVLHYHGIQLNAKDSTGASPLHECASRNLPRPVQLLVDAGADVNTRHGRTGITPLQAACSVKFPDPETVRSLLDKGAHPNWKDTANNSAFDAVIRNYRVRCASSEPLAEDADNPLSPIEYFVQNALPVLMELVKKGGRYTEASVESLRPSFKDAINGARIGWGAMMEQEYFASYMAAKGAADEKAVWTADSTSAVCLMCLDKFTYSSRRHHCRYCGILCCAICSTKRLCLKVDPVPRGNGAGDRVCDGCFNKLSFEAGSRDLMVQKAQRELDRQDSEISKSVSLPPPATPLFTPSSPAQPQPPDVATAAHAIGAAVAQAQDNAEKASDVRLQTQQLLKETDNFNKMALELKRSQEAKHWLGGSSSSKKLYR